MYVLRYIDKEVAWYVKKRKGKKRATRTCLLIRALVSFPTEATEHTSSFYARKCSKQSGEIGRVNGLSSCSVGPVHWVRAGNLYGRLLKTRSCWDVVSVEISTVVFVPTCADAGFVFGKSSTPAPSFATYKTPLEPMPPPLLPLPLPPPPCCPPKKNPSNKSYCCPSLKS